MRSLVLRALAMTAAFAWLGAAAGRAQPAPTAPPPPAAPTPPPAPAPAEPGPWAALADAAGPGRWYFQGEVVFLRRDVPRRNLGFDSGLTGNANDNTSIDTTALDFPFEPALRLTFGYRLDRDLSLELGYLGAVEWNDAKTVFPTQLTGPFGNLFSQFPIAVAPFDFAVSQTQTYSSAFDSFEVNLRWQAAAPAGVSLSGLVGLRYYQNREDFTFSAVSTFAGGGPLFTGAYNVHARNRWLGPQIGGDLGVNFGDLGLMGSAKLGLGLNRGKQHSDLINAIAPDGTDLSGDGRGEHTNVSEIVELGLHAYYRVGSFLTVRVGYQALAINNLVLAPRQLNFALETFAQTGSDHHGAIFYHGPSAGLQLTW